MTQRTAECQCGQLRAVCRDEPVRVSVCHCLDCQRRSGSAFAAQARWPAEQVVISGEWKVWTRRTEQGSQFTARFSPACGSTIAYDLDSMPGLIAIPLGAFADPAFPPPRISVYEERKHPWLAILAGEVEHHH